MAHYTVTFILFRRKKILQWTETTCTEHPFISKYKTTQRYMFLFLPFICHIHLSVPFSWHT